MSLKDEIRVIIANRELSQWHLMIASLLGSLASQRGMFNQAFLNKILKHSMDNFIIPYFETLDEYKEAIAKVQSGASLNEKLQAVVFFIDHVFSLAGEIELAQKDDTQAVVRIGSSSCRFCPIGVGRAELTPGMTFCPFPTMIEKTAQHMLENSNVKTVFKREHTQTLILQKKDGSCYITYEATE
jgi:hypothetical protein